MGILSGIFKARDKPTNSTNGSAYRFLFGGTNYGRTGQFTGKGIFTIVQESNGEGATLWGKLKSGAGWISLDFAKKL
mgnify:CR=1 FL=1